MKWTELAAKPDVLGTEKAVADGLFETVDVVRHPMFARAAGMDSNLAHPDWPQQDTKRGIGELGIATPE